MKKGIITLLALALMAPVAMAQMGQPGSGGGFGYPMGDGWGAGQRGPGYHGRMNCDGPRQGRRGDGIGRLLLVADEIGLTEDQQEQLEQLRVDFQLAQIDRRSELRKAQVQMRTLMRDDEASQPAVNRAIDEIAGLRAGLHKAQYAHRQQMQNLLTDEQVAKLKALRTERFQDRWDGRGGKMGRGQGRGWRRP